MKFVFRPGTPLAEASVPSNEDAIPLLRSLPCCPVSRSLSVSSLPLLSATFSHNPLLFAPAAKPPPLETSYGAFDVSIGAYIQHDNLFRIDF